MGEVKHSGGGPHGFVLHQVGVIAQGHVETCKIGERSSRALVYCVKRGLLAHGSPGVE